MLFVFLGGGRFVPSPAPRAPLLRFGGRRPGAHAPRGAAAAAEAALRQAGKLRGPGWRPAAFLVFFFFFFWGGGWFCSCVVCFVLDTIKETKLENVFFSKQGSLNDLHFAHPFETCGCFNTKIKGNHHVQGNVQVNNVRIPVV